MPRPRPLIVRRPGCLASSWLLLPYGFVSPNLFDHVVRALEHSRSCEVSLKAEARRKRATLPHWGRSVGGYASHFTTHQGRQSRLRVLQTKGRYRYYVRFACISRNNLPRLLRRVRANTGREQAQQTASLFDDLIGGGEQFVRDGQPEHPGGLVVDDQLELRRLHDRQFRRLG